MRLLCVAEVTTERQLCSETKMVVGSSPLHDRPENTIYLDSSNSYWDSVQDP